MDEIHKDAVCITIQSLKKSFLKKKEEIHTLHGLIKDSQDELFIMLYEDACEKGFIKGSKVSFIRDDVTHEGEISGYYLERITSGGPVDYVTGEERVVVVLSPFPKLKLFEEGPYIEELTLIKDDDTAETN